MRFFKSKRGDETLGAGSLVKLLIILASAIVLFIFAIKVSSSGIFGETERQLCRTTLLGQGLANEVKDGLIEPKCPTYNIRFYEQKVEINGKEVNVVNPSTGKSQKKFEHLNERIVSQVVAEEMRLCWWQFWEGKKKFGESYVLWNSEGDNCFICDEISFSSDVKSTEFKGFYSHIKDTKMPNSEKTYYAYIADSKSMYEESIYSNKEKLVWEQFAGGIGIGKAITSGKFGTREKINTDIVFETGKPYAIIFIREGQQGKKLLGASTKETSQGIESSMTYFTYVVPAEKLTGVCNSVSRGVMT